MGQSQSSRHDRQIKSVNKYVINWLEPIPGLQQIMNTCTEDIYVDSDSVEGTQWQNIEPLILDVVPKNIKDNWNQYKGSTQTHRNSKHNILSPDQYVSNGTWIWILEKQTSTD